MQWYKYQWMAVRGGLLLGVKNVKNDLRKSPIDYDTICEAVLKY